MRIACFGLVERTGGSVTAANFLILEELLKRGHEIDFYTFEGFVNPQELFAYRNFRYIAVETREERTFYEKTPPFLLRLLDRIPGLIFYNYLNLPKMERRLAAEHAEQAYDVLLFLGTTAQTEAPKSLPVVSWVQGPPQTEWEAIKSLKRKIVELCGRVLYLQAKGFYAFKKRRVVREMGRSDVVICGSQWSRDEILRFGVPPSQVVALPYPMDLELFQPNGHAASGTGESFTYLWLGRMDPRKRLDLMVDAFALLAQKYPDVHLKVVGPVGYAAGYRSLIERFPLPGRLTWIQGANRAEIPALINGADVVVQPSQSENFGSAVAEALCCGKPVVLGATNGTKDYTGAASFIFKEYTPEALMRAMEQARTAVIERREALAAEARAKAEAEFGVSQIVDRLEDSMRRLQPTVPVTA